MGPGLVSHWLWQSALRMRGLFNQDRTDEGGGEGVVSIRLADAWPFQPGLTGTKSAARQGVSIRLADAWPFQLARIRKGLSYGCRFNPPCGCVAFSTIRNRTSERGLPTVSIRLADAWPFQRRQPACSTAICGWFQSALRMRGLFNEAG